MDFERAHDALVSSKVWRRERGIGEVPIGEVIHSPPPARGAQTGPPDADYHPVMDLTYPPEAEAFRKDIRAWLEENLPEGWF